MKRDGFSSIDLAYLRMNSDGSCWMFSCSSLSRSSALLFEDVAEVRWDDVYTSQSVNKPTERVGFGFRLSW